MIAGDVVECFGGRNQQPPGSSNGPTMATGWYRCVKAVFCRFWLITAFLHTTLQSGILHSHYSGILRSSFPTLI